MVEQEQNIRCERWSATCDRLQQAESALGIWFNNSEILQQALVHSSVLNEPVPNTQEFEQSNERLEYLGDALIDFIVAEYLFQEFPDHAEGQLTVYRAALVRTETLARWARAFHLDEFLYLAQGEQGYSGIGIGDRVLAGAFEAVIAAIYQDKGIEAAREFIVRLLDQDAEQIIFNQQTVNYKGKLQERIQALDQTTPAYGVVKLSGPPHNRHFVVQVQHRGENLGLGEGPSKRIAEQAAARDALYRLDMMEESEHHGRSL